MGQTTTEVRHEIEATRGHMSDTIDSIADRTSPRRIVARKRHRLADRVHGIRDAVMGSVEDVYEGTQRRAEHMTDSAHDSVESLAEGVREAPQELRRQTQGNPFAAGLVAFGAGMLAAALIPSSPMERQAASDLRDHAQPMLDELKQAGREVAGEVGESVQEAAEEVKVTASESMQQVAEEAKQSDLGPA